MSIKSDFQTNFSTSKRSRKLSLHRKYILQVCKSNFERFLYNTKGIEIIGASTKKLYAKQKNLDSKKHSSGTTVPICCKLTKITTERFFSRNPKIVKNRPNSIRKHSKGPHKLKLSKTIQFIVMKQVEKNSFKFLSWGLP